MMMMSLFSSGIIYPTFCITQTVDSNDSPFQAHLNFYPFMIQVDDECNLSSYIYIIHAVAAGKAQCSAPAVPLNSNIQNLRLSYKDRDMINVTCNEVTNGVPEWFELTCADGIWNGQNIVCPDPVKGNNGPRYDFTHIRTHIRTQIFFFNAYRRDHGIVRIGPDEAYHVTGWLLKNIQFSFLNRYSII